MAPPIESGQKLVSHDHASHWPSQDGLMFDRITFREHISMSSRGRECREINEGCGPQEPVAQVVC